MAEEKNTQFNYLLNAVEHAGREAHPAKAGYAGKRKALLAHVRELERKAAEAEAAVAAERERCASLVPTSWLDPLLTGKGGMGQPPYSCPDIERLLSALAAAIRAGNAGVKDLVPVPDEDSARAERGYVRMVPAAGVADTCCGRTMVVGYRCEGCPHAKPADKLVPRGPAPDQNPPPEGLAGVGGDAP